MSENYEPDYTDAAEPNNSMSDLVKSLHGWSVMIGAVVGIVVGLFIGWVVWPVQWTDAWPSDLSQEAKAQYLASIAQVYAFYPDDSAEEVARMRLYDLNDNLEEEIANAQAYFGNNPQMDSRIYMNNLANLAQGLGVQSDDIIAVQPEAGAGIDSAGEATLEDAVVESSEGSSWLRWLLSILLVVLLIGGGIYILSRMARRGDDADGYLDDSSEGGEADDPFSVPPPGDYSFDSEPEDEAYFTANTAVVEPEPYAESDFKRPSSSGVETEPTSERNYFGPSAAAVRSPSTVEKPQPHPYSPVDAGKALNTYIVNFQAGIIDFEQSHTINDPATNEYIGECGMGVNVKNGILHDNPENVIALDVWLYDKKQDRSKGNQTRVLLSEYAIDNGLEPLFIRQMPDAPAPIVAQPGLSFQLVGAKLVLDCEVLDAEYTSTGEDDGIFQNLKVELTVRAKN